MKKIQLRNDQVEILLPIIAYLVAVDGKIKNDEILRFKEFLDSSLFLTRDPLKGAEKLWNKTDEILKQDIDQILNDIDSKLDTEAKENGYKLLILIAFADGEFHPNENDFLIKVKNAFSITDEESIELFEQIKDDTKIKIPYRKSKYPLKLKYVEVVFPLLYHMMGGDDDATRNELSWFENLMKPTLSYNKEVREEVRVKIMENSDEILSVDPQEYIERAKEILSQDELEELFDILTSCLSTDLTLNDQKVGLLIEIGSGFGFNTDKIMLNLLTSRLD